MARNLANVLKINDFLDDRPSREIHRAHRWAKHGSTEKGCGKRRLSREQAKDAVRKAKFQRSKAEGLGGEVFRREGRIYPCPVCPGRSWHISSKPGREVYPEVA